MNEAMISSNEFRRRMERIERIAGVKKRSTGLIRSVVLMVVAGILLALAI